MPQIYDLTVSPKHTDGTLVPYSRAFPYEDTGITQQEAVTFTIAPGVTNQLLNMGQMTSLKHVVLDISGALTIRLNGTTGTPIDYGATGGNFTLFGSDITAIYVTNAGAVAVTIRGFVAA